MLTLTFGVVILTFAWICYQKIKRRNLPPGPIPWPIVGSVFEVAAAGSPISSVAHFNLSKKYGNIFSIQIGTVQTIVLSGHEMIKKLLKTEEYDNRMEEHWVLDRTYGKKLGILFGEGKFWRDTRKLVLRILYRYGFENKNKMEVFIQEEFEELCLFLRKRIENDGERIEVNRMFNGPMTNVLSTLIMGKRISLEDPKLKGLLKGLDIFIRAGRIGGATVLSAFPFLSKYLPDLCGFTEIQESGLAVRNYFEEIIRETREEGNFKKFGPTNFIEEFLELIDANREDKSGLYTDENLVCCLNDLFSAGSDTSANTIGMAIRFFVQHLEVQRKLREEIDRIIGKRLLSMDDKPSLRFLDATVLEILRWTNVVPIAARRAVKTFHFGEYIIPQGTIVEVNFYTIQFEKEVWGDPENFRPERFLSPNEDEIINADKLVSFGFGKRNCIGENTARTTVFLGIGFLIQNFIFEVDPHFGIPKSEDNPGFTVGPKPFNILIKNRY